MWDRFVAISGLISKDDNNKDGGGDARWIANCGMVWLFLDEEPRKQTPPNKQHTDANTDDILPFKMPFELQRDLFGEPSATAATFAEIVSEAKPKAVKRFVCFFKSGERWWWWRLKWNFMSRVKSFTCWQTDGDGGIVTERQTEKNKQLTKKCEFFRLQFTNLSKQLIPNNLPRLGEFMGIAIWLLCPSAYLSNGVLCCQRA